MIEAIDHVVLTVRDPDAAAAFYARVLGMEPLTFAGNRRAVRFGGQKINLQRLGDETRNHATIGSGDLCLLTRWPTSQTLAHLAAEGVEVVEGPVRKSGARGTITSVYFRDPDGNLIEISRYGGEEDQ
ncbi:VOC family protein [Frigidibacter sp. ROC022]|uniref:VOC family protein n=1 Tax=Frigidibacter sp. ROC022 TaxID=2971796 RepID=UPI00215A7A2F|nr:VOC family protein [Frigidibacter sp. ROC022]MCR8725107.1 VOC family protein [Frigidibacter sp. ROC022]